MRNILVTGGCGFIGFNFIKYIIQNFQDVYIVNLDKRTYAAQYLLQQKLKFFNENVTRVIDYCGDICDGDFVQKLVNRHQIQGIINFAAQTHVDNSIQSPQKFIKSNINGVFTLLQVVRKYNLRFHQVGTDQVYGSVDVFRDVVKQNFKLDPSSPYSSSKASADLLVRSYFKTFNSMVTITRTTNNYGPYQDPSKLIPKAITLFNKDLNIGVYGNGQNVRNWLYVLDHCIGIWKVYNSKIYGQVFNIGSKTLLSNNQILSKILMKMNKPLTLIKYIADRKGHDFGYHLNSQKIQYLLDWKQMIQFQKGLQYTIKFYTNK